jgi:hypothetical protein
MASHIKDEADLEGLNMANIDPYDRELVERLREKELREAGVRIKAAVQRLQDLGIIDEEGRLLKTELPPDMREGSDTDFGG